MIREALLALVEWIGSCRCGCLPKKEQWAISCLKLQTETCCMIITDLSVIQTVNFSKDVSCVYLPMFFILIFASGGISSGSLCMASERFGESQCIFMLIKLLYHYATVCIHTYIIIFIKNRCQPWLFGRDWWYRFFGLLKRVSQIFIFFIKCNIHIWNDCHFFLKKRLK